MKIENYVVSVNFFALAAAVAFGFWQSNKLAGLFMFLFISAVYQIRRDRK